MTSEQFVKIHYPKMNIESHKGKDKKKYYLCRSNKDSMYFSQGFSEKETWIEAQKKILKKYQINNEFFVFKMQLPTNETISHLFSIYFKSTLSATSYSSCIRFLSRFDKRKSKVLRFEDVELINHVTGFSNWLNSLQVKTELIKPSYLSPYIDLAFIPFNGR